MDDKLYESLILLKEGIEKDPRVIRLNELDDKLNHNEEVMILSYKKDTANTLYNDALKFFKEGQIIFGVTDQLVGHRHRHAYQRIPAQNPHLAIPRRPVLSERHAAIHACQVTDYYIQRFYPEAPGKRQIKMIRKQLIYDILRKLPEHNPKRPGSFLYGVLYDIVNIRAASRQLDIPMGREKSNLRRGIYAPKLAHESGVQHKIPCRVVAEHQNFLLVFRRHLLPESHLREYRLHVLCKIRAVESLVHVIIMIIYKSVEDYLLLVCHFPSTCSILFCRALSSSSYRENISRYHSILSM